MRRRALPVLLVLGVLAAGAALLRDDDAAGRQALRPVLLVPGYGGNPQSLQVAAAPLRATGREVTVIDPPGDGRRDLRETARTLDAAVDTALAAGADSVDVVGFSAGGITARYWAAELGGAEVAAHVVTLGSPHHGTDLARLGAAQAPESCPQACRQLAPDSDLLRQLNSGDETPDGPEWTSIWTDGDQVVTPPDSARLDGAANVVVQDVCPGAVVSHGGLVSSPAVAALVQRALGSDVPVDCARAGA